MMKVGTQATKFQRKFLVSPIKTVLFDCSPQKALHLQNIRKKPKVKILSVKKTCSYYIKHPDTNG